MSLIKFGLVGLLNSAIGIAVIFASLNAGMGDYTANALGYGVGLLISYTANRRWTFNVKDPASIDEFLRFAGCFFVAYAGNLLVIKGFRMIGLVDKPSVHLAGMAVYSVLFYTLSRHFTFGDGFVTSRRPFMAMLGRNAAEPEISPLANNAGIPRVGFSDPSEGEGGRKEGKSFWRHPASSKWGSASDVLYLSGLLVACALFMFVDRQTSPIIIWDESRLAVNALEMYERGWSLVTTYGFAPDLWNTKPPLMIWLMNASMHAFGPSDISLRVPSMVAALGTLIIVFTFVWNVTKSRTTAGIAVILLTASVGFYGEHGARTADYDALLCFFTTAYLALLYRSFHQRQPGWLILLASAALIGAATMTKTVAGVLPGVGAVGYVLLTGRHRRVFASPRYALMAICALVPLISFYFLRERLAPGYLNAVSYNDAIGRYSSHLELHENPPWFYVRAVFLDGLFSAGPLSLLAPIAIQAAKGRKRQAANFALCCFVGQLITVSLVATKLHQYILPGLPWLAIACAIGIDARARQALASRDNRRLFSKDLAILAALLAAATINIGVRTLTTRYSLLIERAYYPQASYGILLTSMHDSGVRHVVIVEPGINSGGEPDYAPQLRYYSLLWKRRGMTIDRLDILPKRWPKTVIASCDPKSTIALLASGGTSIGQTGCSALSR